MAAEEAFGDEHIRWRRRPRRGICRHVCRGFHPPSHGMELCPSGHFALRVRFAKAAGATVIATSSSDEKLARLKDLGADHLITHAGNSSAEYRAMRRSLAARTARGPPTGRDIPQPLELLLGHGSPRPQLAPQLHSHGSKPFCQIK